MAGPVKGTLRQLMRSNQPVPSWVVASTWVDVVAITAGTASSYTIPTGISALRLTPTVSPVYGSFVETAVVPTTGVTTGTASFPVPQGLEIVAPNDGDTLSLICASASVVTIEGWA
jgi:hypothetical protein